LGFYALMLRSGERLRLTVRSPASIYHVIEGDVEITSGTNQFILTEADTCCIPGFSDIALNNRSERQPAFIFIADEAPLHRKLGLLETRT
jgi:gentisate 1,2-dioxygenase